MLIVLFLFLVPLLAGLVSFFIKEDKAVRTWSLNQHPPWRLIGAEREITAPVPPAVGDPTLSPRAATRPVVLSGRIDWLSADESNRQVVVDFKTSASEASRAAAADNAQLASYQIALGGTVGNPQPGGGRLVYLKKGTSREQPPLTPEQRTVWIGRIRGAADALATSTVTATANSYCDICAVRTSCPIQPDGRQVTR